MALLVMMVSDDCRKMRIANDLVDQIQKRWKSLTAVAVQTDPPRRMDGEARPGRGGVGGEGGKQHICRHNASG